VGEALRCAKPAGPCARCRSPSRSVGAAGAALPAAAATKGRERRLPPTQGQPGRPPLGPRGEGTLRKGRRGRKIYSEIVTCVCLRLSQRPPPAGAVRAALAFDWQKVSGSRSGRAWRGSAAAFARNLPDLAAEISLGRFDVQNNFLLAQIGLTCTERRWTTYVSSFLGWIFSEASGLRLWRLALEVQGGLAMAFRCLFGWMPVLEQALVRIS